MLLFLLACHSCSDTLSVGSSFLPSLESKPVSVSSLRVSAVGSDPRSHQSSSQRSLHHLSCQAALSSRFLVTEIVIPPSGL